MQTNQKLQVRKNDVMSNRFNVKNGIRQRGAMSQLLFGFIWMGCLGLFDESNNLVLSVISGNITAELQIMQITMSEQ